MKRVIPLMMVVLLSGSLQGCFPVVAAGVGAGVMMGQDRRTSGAYVEDQAIELKANRLISDQFPQNVHVNITSFNRKVLLSGEVPSNTLKKDVERIVADIENVVKVYNELQIAAPSSVASRGSDAVTTSNVKLRLVKNKQVNANRIKVVTENGTVFLMGMVTRQEAEEATETARTTGGVQRVIKLFEYLD